VKERGKARVIYKPVRDRRVRKSEKGGIKREREREREHNYDK
jgi:hypothetical protein